MWSRALYTQRKKRAHIKAQKWEARHMFKKTKNKLKARQAGRSEREGALPRMILERQGIGHGMVRSQKQNC